MFGTHKVESERESGERGERKEERGERGEGGRAREREKERYTNLSKNTRFLFTHFQYTI